MQIRKKDLSLLVYELELLTNEYDIITNALHYKIQHIEERIKLAGNSNEAELQSLRYELYLTKKLQRELKENKHATR